MGIRIVCVLFGTHSILVLATSCADQDVAKSAPGCPVALAALAEMAGLVDVVVVVVAELGVYALTTGARDELVGLLQALLLLLLLRQGSLRGRIAVFDLGLGLGLLLVSLLL
jgi:hypothetical protein